jgi:hypothetical protein
MVGSTHASKNQHYAGTRNMLQQHHHGSEITARLQNPIFIEI